MQTLSSAKVLTHTLSCSGVPHEFVPYISVCTFSCYFQYLTLILKKILSLKIFEQGTAFLLMVHCLASP